MKKKLAITLATVALCSVGFTACDKVDFDKGSTPDPLVNTGAVVEPSGTIELMSTTIELSEYETYGVSEDTYSARLVTAWYLNDTYVSNPAVEWSVKFNASTSDWARNKNVNDYVTVTKKGTLSAVVEAKQSFSEPIVLTCWNVEKPSASKSITLDCIKVSKLMNAYFTVGKIMPGPSTGVSLGVIQSSVFSTSAHVAALSRGMMSGKMGLTFLSYEYTDGTIAAEKSTSTVAESVAMPTAFFSLVAQTEHLTLVRTGVIEYETHDVLHVMAFPGYQWLHATCQEAIALGFSGGELTEEQQAIYDDYVSVMRALWESSYAGYDYIYYTDETYRGEDVYFKIRFVIEDVDEYFGLTETVEE